MGSPSPPSLPIDEIRAESRTWFPPSPIDDEYRLYMPFFMRVSTCSSLAFFAGAALGGIHGSKLASMRFRAENSHRFPTTTHGWYLYHKSKNYNCALAAIKEGLKFGPRIAGWAGGVFFVEETVDHLRGTRDAGSTVIAGLAMSGIFSLKHGFNVPLTARTARTGLVLGLGMGLTQDVVALLEGRRLKYIDALFGRRGD
ncbi:MAG: hypothetical protein Q9170_002158 [Blastenia crenularia]